MVCFVFSLSSQSVGLSSFFGCCWVEFVGGLRAAAAARQPAKKGDEHSRSAPSKEEKTIDLWVERTKWNEVSLLFVSFIHEWWKANERQWNEVKATPPQGAKRSAVREQTTQQPLIAAGRGKPAINWWLVCFSLPFLSIRAACSPPPPAHSALGLFAGAPFFFSLLARLFSSFIQEMKGRKTSRWEKKKWPTAPHAKQTTNKEREPNPLSLFGLLLS